MSDDNKTPKNLDQMSIKVKEKAALKAAKQAETGKMDLKTPKGTCDFDPKQMVVRKQVLDLLTRIFESHGAEAIDTPVFELRDILLGKYGEEGSKLVYDLADQGGELCSLRYDLTVPFARYVAMNNIQNMKRYQIAKVYRRDNPSMTKGRYREFYQCDFDIAGNTESPMLTEAECLKVADRVLSAFDLGVYEIRVNHRVLLEGIFALAGIGSEAFKIVCSSIDKLDKVPWNEVRAELINEKNINADSVDRLEQYVRARENMTDATNDRLFEFFERFGDEKINSAVRELRLLMQYCEIYKCARNVIFEPSLARGLDYYTGTIYEAVVTRFSFEPPKLENDSEEFSVGSVAAGGRYDKLVGMFKKTSKKKDAADVPCVGISFGIERLFGIMEAKAKAENEKGEKRVMRTNFVDVCVASTSKNLLAERMRVCTLLWDAGINAEHSYKPNPKLLTQFQDAESQGIPLIVIIGENELKAGCVKVKKTGIRDDNGTIVKLEDLVGEIKQRLA